MKTTTSYAFSLPGCEEVEPEGTCSVQLDCVELVELLAMPISAWRPLGFPL